MGADIIRCGRLVDAFNNRDTITDFNVVDDTIQLENAIFTSLISTGSLAAGWFVVGTGALDPNDFVIYDSGSGAVAAVCATPSTGLLSLTNVDFVVT